MKNLKKIFAGLIAVATLGSISVTPMGINAELVEIPYETDEWFVSFIDTNGGNKILNEAREPRTFAIAVTCNKDTINKILKCNCTETKTFEEYEDDLIPALLPLEEYAKNHELDYTKFISIPNEDVENTYVLSILKNEFEKYVLPYVNIDKYYLLQRKLKYYGYTNGGVMYSLKNGASNFTDEILNEMFPEYENKLGIYTTSGGNYIIDKTVDFFPLTEYANENSILYNAYDCYKLSERLNAMGYDTFPAYYMAGEVAELTSDDIVTVEVKSNMTMGESTSITEFTVGESTYPRGDINLDGKVNTLDLLMLKKYLLGLMEW